MVPDIVRAHPEAPGRLPGREEPLGGAGEDRALPGEAGVGQALDGRHAAMLDGAALEERRQVLHRELVEAGRVGPERLEVEPCQIPTQVPGRWTALADGWFSTGPPRKPAKPRTARAMGCGAVGLGALAANLGHSQPPSWSCKATRPTTFALRRPWRGRPHARRMSDRSPERERSPSPVRDSDSRYAPAPSHRQSPAGPSRSRSPWNSPLGWAGRWPVRVSLGVLDPDAAGRPRPAGGTAFAYAARVGRPGNPATPAAEHLDPRTRRDQHGHHELGEPVAGRGLRAEARAFL